MWVTCYADASFVRRGTASWAVWLRSAEGRHVQSGPCPHYVRTSHQAELSALYAGVYLALRLWPSARGVLLCSDCQGALLSARQDSRLSRDPATRRLQEKLRALLERSGVAIELRWVRGHQRANQGTAAWLNRACDRLARKERRRAATAVSSRARRRGR